MPKDLKNGYKSDVRKIPDLALRLWVSGLTVALVVIFGLYLKERGNNDTTWKDRFSNKAGEVKDAKLEIRELKLIVYYKDSVIDRKVTIIDSIMTAQVKMNSEVYNMLYAKVKELEKLKEINEVTIKKLKNVR